VHDGFEMRQLSATTEIPDLGPTMVYASHPVWPVGDSEVWAREMSMIGDILENADPTVPAIVGGDFNATNSHAQFRALVSGRFDDTNAMAGGVLRTYPNGRLPAFLGVDRIPVANGHAESISTVALPGSDHRAVVAHLRFS